MYSILCNGVIGASYWRSCEICACVGSGRAGVGLICKMVAFSTARLRIYICGENPGKQCKMPDRLYYNYIKRPAVWQRSFLVAPLQAGVPKISACVNCNVIWRRVERKCYNASVHYVPVRKGGGL